MPDGLTSTEVDQVGNFVQGLDELTASTGIALAWDGPIHITIRRDTGDESGLFELASDVDDDDVVRYRLNPQR